MKTGIELIAEERQRQIDVYGYSDEHIKNSPEDYECEELACAAACYATPAGDRISSDESFVPTPDLFPWDQQYWKPTPELRIRELVKAGAMIVAEIDRLQNV
jgi:hypothetical protein